MMVKRSWPTVSFVLLTPLFLAFSAWLAPLHSQDSGCSEYQCITSDGQCGWEADGVCYLDIAEAECYLAGGCAYEDGECFVEAGGICRPIPEAECIKAGFLWEDGACVPPPGVPDPTVVPEPETFVLLSSGLLFLGLIAYRKRRQASRGP